jgi:hypothetical protein
VDIGQLSILGVCVLLFAWYIAGSVYNRRRGQMLGRWLQAGLRSLGGKAEYRWIGSSGSGLRASASGLARPITQLEAVLLLETRELLPLWLFQRMSGRHDQLILKLALQRGIKAQLDSAPRVFPPDGWSYIQVTPSLQLTASGDTASQLTDALRPFFERYGPSLRSFSYRTEKPQIVLVLNLTGIENQPAEEIIRSLIRCLDVVNG